MTRILYSAALILALGGCAASTRQQATPPARAVEPISAPRALRVMTFNIQSARHGLDTVAEVIREADADIVALNEVDKSTTRSGGLDQTAELARRAGYPHYVHVRAATLFGGDYGLAVLSKHPIVEAKGFTLPTTRLIETRAVARAVIDLEGQQLSVYVTHLSNEPKRAHLRARQAQFIARLMASDARPKVLAGDLNDTVDSPALLLLSRNLTETFGEAGVGAPETYPLPFPFPNLRLDYVLASKELRPTRAMVVRKLASDHYPLVVDFAPTGRAPGTMVATNP